MHDQTQVCGTYVTHWVERAGHLHVTHRVERAGHKLCYRSVLQFLPFSRHPSLDQVPTDESFSQQLCKVIFPIPEIGDTLVLKPWLGVEKEYIIKGRKSKKPWQIRKMVARPARKGA